MFEKNAQQKLNHNCWRTSEGVSYSSFALTILLLYFTSLDSHHRIPNNVHYSRLLEHPLQQIFTVHYVISCKTGSAKAEKWNNTFNSIKFCTVMMMVYSFQDCSVSGLYPQLLFQKQHKISQTGLNLWTLGFFSQTQLSTCLPIFWSEGRNRSSFWHIKLFFLIETTDQSKNEVILSFSWVVPAQNPMPSNYNKKCKRQKRLIYSRCLQLYHPHFTFQ